MVLSRAHLLLCCKACDLHTIFLTITATSSHELPLLMNLYGDEVSDQVRCLSNKSTANRMRSVLLPALKAFNCDSGHNDLLGFAT